MNEPIPDRRRFPRVPCNGRMPGPLFKRNGREVTCQSTDVSKFGVGILTEFNLDIDAELELKCNDLTIILKPVVKRRDTLMKSFFHIGLLVEGEAIDLEEIFLSAGCLDDQASRDQAKERVERGRRYVPQKNLEFSASLLGTRDQYSFVVENISRTGILLSHPAIEQPPFHVNTLLEMEIDTACVFIAKPLFCTGKVVRLLHEVTAAGEKRLVYGIMISDLETDSKVVEDLINAIEAGD